MAVTMVARGEIVWGRQPQSQQRENQQRCKTDRSHLDFLNRAE
jgi:hypothetical protein